MSEPNVHEQLAGMTIERDAALARVEELTEWENTAIAFRRRAWAAEYKLETIKGLCNYVNPINGLSAKTVRVDKIRAALYGALPEKTGDAQ